MNETAFYKATQAGELSGIYLLHGEEELTKQEAIARAEALLDAGMKDMNHAKLRAATAPEILLAAQQVPFFDRFRVIIVLDPPEEEFKLLVEAGDKIPPETILLLVRRGKSRDTTAVKKLTVQDRVVEFPQLSQSRAMNMVSREAALAGVSIDTALTRKLVERVGTDAYSLRNETSKVLGYAGRGGTVTADMLDICVTSSTETDVFDMLNFFLRGNRKGGLAAVQTMQQNGQSALSISYFLEGRLRQMLIAKELLNAKKPPHEIVRALGGSPYAAEKSISAAKKCSLEMLRQSVIRLAEVEFQLKQGLAADSDSLFLALFSCFK